MLDVGHAPVHVTHDLRPIKRLPDERVHLPGRVDLAHPVVAVGPDAQAVERVDEHLRVMAGVRRVAITGEVGDVRERHAHVALDGVGRQQRLGIHRVEIVDAIEQGRLEPAGPQGSRDDIEDDGPTEAADMDSAGRGLGVVDDLRPLDRCGELVSPVHARSPPVGTRRGDQPCRASPPGSSPMLSPPLSPTVEAGDRRSGVA